MHSSTASCSVGTFSPRKRSLLGNQQKHTTFCLQVGPANLYSMFETSLSHLIRCLAAASSLRNSENSSLLSGPDPFVVRSTVSSCISMGTPSAVNSRSSSTPVAPFSLAFQLEIRVILKRNKPVLRSVD